MVLNTRTQGLPQSRSRLYIVGVMHKHCKRKFTFPPEIPLKFSASALIRTEKPSRRPVLPSTVKCMKRLAMGLKTSHEKFPGKSGVFIDFDSSKPYATHNVCPCITKNRGSTGGFWVRSLKRRMGIRLMGKFQGIRIADLNMSKLSDPMIGSMLGNAWSINVSARVIKHVLISMGRLPETFRDPWMPKPTKRLARPAAFDFPMP
eukprot:1304623-Pyramimonas_sp.AAC.2